MILATITSLLASLGLSARVAQRLAPVVAGIAALAILASLWGAWQVFDWWDDRAAIERDRIKANNDTLARQLDAAEAAARERLRNARTNDETVEALNDAILDPKPGDHPDPGVRLACEQLRRDGQDTAGIPECGGR